VLYCNANAGLYEFRMKGSNWIDFYNNLNMNVILWNYRGYGRSTGSPSPKKLINDGEVLINHMRDKYKLTRIGVHG
jgi:hypothetical protein